MFSAVKNKHALALVWICPCRFFVQYLINKDVTEHTGQVIEADDS